MPDVTYVKQRASKRLRWSLPVLVDSDKTVYTANTEDLSAEGARLKTPVGFAPGALLAVTNLQTGQRAEFRVVWGRALLGDERSFNLGIQMVQPSETFWGFDLTSGRKPLAGDAKPGEGLAAQTLSWRND